MSERNMAHVWASLPWMPDRRSIHDWASEHVTLPPAYTLSGKFSVETSRHFIGPLESLHDDRVREVNVLAPPRTGKTLIGDLFVTHSIANDPGPVLCVFATDTQARLHCETRLMPILDSCAPVACMFPDDRHQKRTTQIQFSNGLPLHVSGPATGNLQARGYRFLICDEVWTWDVGKLREAKARMGDFERLESNKGLFISQGGAGGTGEEDGDQWSRQYHSGIIHDWHVPCLACGHMQPTTWSGSREDGSRWGILFDGEKNAEGSYLVEKASKTVRFVCRQCNHEHANSSATRSLWNAAGAYQVIHDQGDPKVHSFHWNAVITDDWAKLVSRWLTARNVARLGHYKPTVQFRQKELAMFASERSVIEVENPIKRMELTEGAEWKDEKYRFLSVDVQQNHLWVMARAWAASGESRRLYWGKVANFDEVEEIRQRLKIQPCAVLVDAGFNRNVVFGHCVNNGWVASIGWDRDRGFPHKVTENGVPVTVMKAWGDVQLGDPDAGIARDKGRRAKVLPLAVPMLAERLQGLINTGLWVDPQAAPGDDAEREYTKQMGSEIKRSKKTADGGTVWYWQQIRDDNHAWDLARMQVAMAWASGCL